MLQHFQVQTLHPKLPHLGWIFSFYYKQQRFVGRYDTNGQIHLESPFPLLKEIDELRKHIHDLMIYHVYDQER